jgi:anaerobic selenocysteine-containing dehydrogenase
VPSTAIAPTLPCACPAWENPMSQSLTHRVCTLCEANCGIRVHVRDAEVVRIEGDPDDPFSKGHICPKAHGLIEIQKDPDRLRSPMRRTATGFVPIGWDEALDWAAERLTRIRDASSSDAIALYRGNPSSHDSQSLLYWNVLQRAIPTKSQFSAGSLDTWTRWVQAGLMYGGFLNTPVPDIDRCEYLLMLGANPVASNGSLMTAPGIKKRLGALRARGGRLVVVDPRRSETADIADEHLFIRPGTDAAFLLAMIQVLFEEDLVDLAGCAPHVSDLDVVHERIRPYTPERVAASCGISADTIRRLARELAAAPRAAVYGRMGTSVQRFGTLAHWAIDLLNILTGNLDRPGGVLFPKPAVSLAFAGPRPDEETPFGRHQSPVSGYDEIQGEWPLAAFAEEIESEREDRIRALVVIAGNPASSAPNSDRVSKALERLEFMVAIDYYINETTRHADLILPPTTPLEHDGCDVALLHFAVSNVAKWSPAALEREPGMLPVWRTLLGLAKRMMGLGAMSDEDVDALVVAQLIEPILERSRFKDELDAAEIIDALGEEPGPRRILDLLLRLGTYGDGFGRAEGGLSVAALEESVHGIDLGALESSLPASLSTRSGKIELAPRRIIDDLPRLERAIAEEGRDSRLRLIGRRDLRSMNSWLHNLPSLAKGRNRCTLQIAPDDAQRLGLTTGDRAGLESRIASLVVEVEVSDRMAPGVVSLPHGWGHDLPGVQLSVATKRPGVNANRVVDDAQVDHPSGTSVLNGVPVEVSAV